MQQRNKWLFCVRATLVFVIACLAFAGCPVLCADISGSEGNWLMYRGDHYLTGRTSLKGNIDKPAVLWKYRLGSRETYLHLRIAESDKAKLLLPSSDKDTELLDNIIADWRIKGPSMDLDGDGKLVPVPFGRDNSRIAKMLPGVPGLQRFTATAGQGFVHGRYLLQVRKDGEWQTLWDRLSETTIHTTNPIVGDFDKDGKIEIVHTPWYFINIVDPATGDVKEKARIIGDNEIAEGGGRAYGWFGAIDLDGDDEEEFIVMCDFVKYITVLGRRDGKLGRLWIRDVIDPHKKKNPKFDMMLHINPEPVQDVDGDGRKEIVVSMFNEHLDNTWHVLVLDGMTGTIKYDLPNQFLTGLRDANGDGISDLFCTAVPKPGVLIPSPSDISVITLIDGWTPKTIWKLAGESYQEYELSSFPENVSNSASFGQRTILCVPQHPGGPPVFFTRKFLDSERKDVRLTAWSPNKNGRIRELSSVTGPRLQVIAHRTEQGDRAGFLLKANAFEEETRNVAMSNATAQVLTSKLKVPPPSQPVVGKLIPGDDPAIIVESCDETIEAFSVSHNGHGRLKWRVSGTGMGRGAWDLQGVLLADIDANGQLETVVNRYGDGGCARLTVLSAKGKEVWHHDLPDLPAGKREWNSPGLMFWQPGHFTNKKTLDILTLYCKSMDEGCLLDGRTGKQLWTQNMTGGQEYFGRNWLYPFKNPATGLDDILASFFMFYTYDGRTGKPVMAKSGAELLPGKRAWGSYITPLVEDFLNRDDRQVMFCNWEGMALLDMNGSPLWVGAEKQWVDWVFPPVAGDVDGDGKLEVIGPISIYSDQGELTNREVHCVDTTTGHLDWRIALPLSPAPTAPALADIDSDGQMDCIFTIGSTLYAIASSDDGRTGRILWTLELPGTLGRVAVADADGSRRASIVVACDDGYVYGIGDVMQR